MQSNAGGGDDYVPVHTNGHKPPRPSYPGENLLKGFCMSQSMGSKLVIGFRVVVIRAIINDNYILLSPSGLIEELNGE